MKTQTSIILLFLLLFSSCFNEHHDNDEIKKIHFQKSDINLVDSLTFKFVQLETTPDCTIGYISHIEMHNDRIFIHDLHFAKSIFVFDTIGNFITQVGAKGSGPENYIMPFGFSLDTCNRTVIVYDLNRRRLVFYDLDTYEYLTYKEFPFTYLNLFTNDNQFYFFSNYGFDESRDDSYILITDSLLNPISKNWKCNFKARVHQTVSGKSIYEVNNRIFAYHHLQPYIHEILNNDKSKIHSMLSFEGLSFPELDSSMDPTNAQYMRELDNSNTKISAYGIYETKELLFIQLMAGKGVHFAIQNKTNNEALLFNRNDFERAIGLNATILPQGVFENEIICFITHGNINKKETNNTDFQEILNRMNEDDNPILCFFKWK